MHNATFEEIERRLNTPGTTQAVIRRVQRVHLDPFVHAETLQRQRDHWQKIHTTRMTPEQLEEWVESIPGCATCKAKFRKILLVMPPVFGDGWEYWTFAVHNIVNSDIGKPILSFADACKLWNWHLTADNHPA